ncbi:MAG: hypothetical protein AAF245_14255, partial [Pseudomonadota bacterium]
ETIAIEEVQEDGEWRADKTFPADLRAATDSFEVRGYLIPIVPQGYFSQLLLVRDPDDCPFCGTGGYGPTLEVTLKRPINEIPDGGAALLRGTLELIEDPETLQSVRLIDAEVLN